MEREKVPQLPPPLQTNHKEKVSQDTQQDDLASLILDEFKRYEKVNNPEERPRCLLSHLTHPHYLTRVNGKFTIYPCLLCGAKKPLTRGDHDYHFVCNICNVEFHHGCHMFPRKITHPYHFQHPLTLTSSSKSSSEGRYSTYLKSSGSIQNCTWCGKDIVDNYWFYCCSTCNFCLDLTCFQNIPLVFIQNPKSHHHSLILYHRPLLTPCDACGLVNSMEPSYTCFQCYYMVHRSCIDLPRVIKITRHQHRLLHTPYNLTIPLCRICYKTVDIKYGQYSCNNEDCSYVVHSKCATHEEVWDKKELEWEPEEPDESEDLAPFKKVGLDMIKHFSHEEHILKLEKFDGVRDAEKQCQACILPIITSNFYNCIECDFFLHEVCAGLLRKLSHPLHVHPLLLQPYPMKSYDYNACSVCSRKSSGFRYTCSINCGSHQINLCCILVPDYFNHKSHEHPLCISKSKGENKIFCKGCKEISLGYYLQCTICKFAMCYECCTIPDEVYYKYDKHPLSLCYGVKKKEGMYWCEVCEKEIDSTGWFYTCNECCVTIHRQCLFGFSAYMKSGFKFYCKSSTITRVVHNNSNTRPLCVECDQRCPSSVYYEIGWYKPKVLCSFHCINHTKQKDIFLDFGQ